MIGILDAYHFDTTPGNYQEKYIPMMMDYLKQVMPNETFEHYRVAINQFPKDIYECDGYIITGSPASCYDDLDWVKELIKFVQELHANKKKLLGICFGHQLIAHALGGEVVNSDKGWGIGVRSFDMLKYVSWMRPTLDSNKCSLLFSHQDQVTKLPRGGVQLGTDSFCEHQIYSIDNHIFCVQGHPEFTTEYAEERYSTRIDRIGQDVYNQGIDSLQKKTDHLVFGQWMKAFFNT